MAKIIKKEILAPQIVKMELESPLIAEKRKAGQYVIIRAWEKGERIPLTIVSSDKNKGTITIIFQVVGTSTYRLSKKEEGQEIPTLTGPLGKPTEIKKYGTVVVIGGGIGTAIALPIAEAMKNSGNYTIAIWGARSKNLLILEKEIRLFADEVYITTDDGSYGRKGFVTDALKEILNDKKVDKVVAIGPVPMMKFVSKMTKEFNIPTIVSLNPIMIDGTGMCGGCRVSINGNIQYACVDGPEFDGHSVDFELLEARLSAYREFEQLSFEKCKLEESLKNNG